MNFKYKNNKIYDEKIYINNKTDINNFNLLCTEYSYLPTFINKVDRIIGIGDIHGDLELTIKFLKIGKLIEDIHKKDFIIGDCIKIPINVTKIEFQQNYNNLSDILLTQNNGTFKYFKYYKWIGKNTYVVQIGDQIDRCRPFNNSECSKEDMTNEDENSDLLIMEIFDCLHKIAVKHNGAVYSLIGNHEVMNFDGDFRYVSYRGTDDYENSKLIEKRINEFNKMRKKFACTRNAIIVIGDFVFVHGGLANLLISNYKLENINEIIRVYILDKFENIKNNKIKEIYNQIVNSSSLSPLWHRNLAMIPPDNENDKGIINKDCKTYFEPLKNYFSEKGILNLKGLIIGHTPQLSIHNKGINTACNKGIIRIDIGASKAFNNIFDEKDIKYRQPQVIEILNNETIKILI